MKEIELTQGKVALVDDEDYEWLSAFNWYAAERKNTFYAARMTSRPNRTVVFMHQMLISPPDGFMADHRNGEGLDNQKQNLRIATSTQNNTNKVRQSNNTSGIAGVSWNTEKSKWHAYVNWEGHRTHVGYFDLLTDAARNRELVASQIHGEFASQR